MNAKKARAARQAARASAPRVRGDGPRSAGFWTSWKGGIVGLAAVAVVVGSFVLPDTLSKKSVSAGAQHAMSMGAEQGAGLPTGSPVPSFQERDVETGRPITSKTLYRQKTLLFFSEGVMCQACFEQIKGLEGFGGQLEQRGIRLVSITPDSPGGLRRAIAQYGITTPMISDSDRSLSEAFNTLGRGMHSDTPGHAFALIDQGKVLWYHDYWLPPDQTMYVQPKRLLADILAA